VTIYLGKMELGFSASASIQLSVRSWRKLGDTVVYFDDYRMMCISVAKVLRLSLAQLAALALPEGPP
jgi:hypothetical protein